MPRFVYALIALVALVALEPAADAAPRTATLKQIMADPSWIARSPTSPRWTADGSAVVFERRRDGADLNDTYRLPLDGSTPLGAAEIVPDAELPALGTGAVWWPGGEAALFEHAGDIFLLKGRDPVQLTRTTDMEAGAAFMVGGQRIRFSRGGTVLVRDLRTGADSEPADVRVGDAPSADKPKEDRPYTTKQQERYFDFITQRRQLDEQRDAQRKARNAADDTRVPGPFYLGDVGDIRRRSLSPSGDHMLVVASRRGGDARGDIMPNYVTDDGYVSSSSLRPKVGEEKPGDLRLFLLDLAAETHVELDLSALPTISEDPLAWAREKQGLKPLEGPRPVTLMGLAWSSSGRYAAVMLRSADNKDRWIALVDAKAKEPALTPIHHLRDDAWINWDFNEMGWLRTGDRLWFLSEETGHAHLMLHTPSTGSTEPLTAGTFQVQDVTPAPDHTALYFRTNRFDPTIYELERYDLQAGKTQPMTLLGGSVDAYQVSPTGDRILLTWSSAMDPPELFIMPTEPMAKPTRLTFTDEKAYRGFDWVEPEFVTIPSSHAERPIRARLYRDPAQTGECPCVFFVHGAGYTQHVYRGWSYYFREHLFATLLVRKGFVVVAPDFRASAGYGRDWRTAIYRRMGTPELEDFEDCIRWLDGEADIDTDRVGLWGGSYGGFLTLMAMFQRPDLFKAGAALRSVTDWAQYNHEYTSNILNTPDLDPEAYERSSPIEFAEGLDGALLMCHGMLDDNVVAQDTIRLAQRLIELEKENWEMALYPIEPHGFREPTGWLDEYRRILALFERELAE